MTQVRMNHHLTNCQFEYQEYRTTVVFALVLALGSLSKEASSNCLTGHSITTSQIHLQSSNLNFSDPSSAKRPCSVFVQSCCCCLFYRGIRKKKKKE